MKILIILLLSCTLLYGKDTASDFKLRIIQTNSEYVVQIKCLNSEWHSVQEAHFASFDDARNWAKEERVWLVKRYNFNDNYKVVWEENK